MTAYLGILGINENNRWENSVVLAVTFSSSDLEIYLPSKVSPHVTTFVL